LDQLQRQLPERWLLLSCSRGYANGEALQYGASFPNLIGTGNSYSNTRAGGGDFYGPSFIGGKLTRPTFGVSGDSNHSGVLVSGAVCDVPDTLQGAIGSVARLLTPYMVGIDASVPGATAFEMSDYSKTTCRDRLLNITDNIFYALGTNDMIFNNCTAAQVDGYVEAAKSRHTNKSYFYSTIPAVVTFERCQRGLQCDTRSTAPHAQYRSPHSSECGRYSSRHRTRGNSRHDPCTV